MHYEFFIWIPQHIIFKMPLVCANGLAISYWYIVALIGIYLFTNCLATSSFPRVTYLSICLSVGQALNLFYLNAHFYMTKFIIIERGGKGQELAFYFPPFILVYQSSY